MTASARDFARFQVPAAGLALFAVSLIAYSPVVHGSFIWDDDHYVTAQALRSWHGLWLIWTKPGATQQYFPLLHTAFWFQWHAWGQSAFAYHLANVAFHACAACLFGLVVARLEIGGAFVASVLFALHPVAVESVAWIAEEKNTLSAVFFMGAALFYLRFDSNRKRSGYMAATCLFAMALMTKTTTAPLPAVLLVVLWWKRGNLSWRHDVLPLVPWFILAASFGLFTAWVEHSLVGARGSDFELSALQHFLLASKLIWFYLGKFVWPIDLNLGYSRWNIDPRALQFWIYVAALGTALGIGWAARRRTRAPLAVALCFVGLLVPVLGFLNIYWFIYSYAADHFQYLADTALFAGAAAAWQTWRTAKGGCAPLAAAAAIASLLGSLTWSHCKSYRNLETLYRDTLKNTPESWFAQNNLGVLLRDSGRAPEAIAHLEEAVRLRQDAISHYNLGVALALTGKSNEAIARYERALQIEPNYPGVHYDLARALAAAGRLQEAIAHYREALRLGLSLAEVHINYGNALADNGQSAEAAQEYRKALETKPGSSQAHYYWGNLLINSGQYSDAIPHLDEAIRIQPNYPEAHYDLGVALAHQGRNPEAIKEYQAAVRFRANYPQAESNLGAALAMEGNLLGAIEHCKRALALNPNNAAAHYNLGLSLQNLGLAKEAREQFQEAARLGGTVH